MLGKSGKICRLWARPTIYRDFREELDSAPCMTLRGQFDLGGFQNLGLWKAAVLGGIGQYSPVMSLQFGLQTNKPPFKAP
jgi:hypothetical protein